MKRIRSKQAKKPEGVWVSAPTRTYRGSTTAEGVKVVVDDGHSAQPLKPRPSCVVPFTWGNRGASAGARELALAILTDAVGEQEALALHTRFNHRIVAAWTEGTSWSITLPEIHAVLADIRQVGADTAGQRAQVARELPKLEGGGLPVEVVISPKDNAPDRHLNMDDPATQKARQSALAKLTPDERRALGL